MAERTRLDLVLVDRGYFDSREQARRAVMAGLVDVDGRRVDKPGSPVGIHAAVTVRGSAEPFVSRGGRKLAAALDAFGVDARDRVALDVGASTGGFTDCLLQRGARRVYAVDVGYGQLDQRLREDSRVVVMERVNARHLPPDALPERVDLVTVDVSFISLLKVVPALLPHLRDGGLLLPLIKPQFEAGRREVGAGGVVRDPELRRAVIDRVLAGLADLGLERQGLIDSPVPGPAGNVEALALLRAQSSPLAARRSPPRGTESSP